MSAAPRLTDSAAFKRAASLPLPHAPKLRGLKEPVRTLAEAIADVTRSRTPTA